MAEKEKFLQRICRMTLNAGGVAYFEILGRCTLADFEDVAEVINLQLASIRRELEQPERVEPVTQESVPAGESGGRK